MARAERCGVSLGGSENALKFTIVTAAQKASELCLHKRVKSNTDQAFRQGLPHLAGVCTAHFCVARDVKPDSKVSRIRALRVLFTLGCTCPQV